MKQPILVAPPMQWGMAPSRRPLGRMAAGSAVLHLLLILLLIPWARERLPPEPLPPPAVAMVFESGSRAGPSVPEPTPQAAIPTPPAPPPAPPAPEAPGPPPPPSHAGPTPPLPTPPLAEAPPSVSLAVPPPPPAPALALPAPPPVPAAPVPLPPAPPKTAALTAPLPPSVPRTRVAPEERPRSPSAFPAPMKFSFGPTQPPASAPRSRAPENEAMGPAARGPTVLGRFAQVTKGKVDADWLNDLHRWWLQHRYYPEQAAMAGEDGTVEVQIVMDRYGRVHTVDLEGRSGSQWLDMGAQAVFRGANLPPFPPGTRDDEITLAIRINYILVRR